MTKQFIETVLLALANERKVFWSEADFQFAFAWKLKEMFEDRNPQSTINVRLERRADTLEQRTDAPEQGNEKENSGDIYIDICTLKMWSESSTSPNHLATTSEKGMLLCSQMITCIGISPKQPQTPPPSVTLEFMTGGKLSRARNLIGTHRQIIDLPGRKN